MFLLKWAFVLSLLYVALLGGMIVFQRAFMYFPDRRYVSPSQAGLSGVEELRLRTNDGETLIAWRVPPREGRPTILYFHGNAGALADRAANFRGFMARGYGLLAVSYRGYGGSTGSPTQAGLMLDGETAYAVARARGDDPRRIVLLGESLGAGIAVALAAKREAAAVVLDAPSSSAVDVAAWHYPAFPVRRLMADQFRSDLAIANVRAPLLIVHGDDDDVVPIRFGRRLFDLANEPKTFVSVPGGGHLVLGREDVFARVCAWIDAATAAP